MWSSDLSTPLGRVHAALGPSTDTRVILDDVDKLFWGFRYIQGREAWQVNGALIERYCPPLGPGVAERFAWSKTVTDQQFAEGTAYRARFTEHLTKLLGKDGVLVLPTMPDIAPLTTDGGEKMESYRNRSLQMLSLSGLSGFPQVSMPLGSRLGAPLGLSLLGPAGSDASLVRLAQRIVGTA